VSAFDGLVECPTVGTREDDAFELAYLQPLNQGPPTGADTMRRFGFESPLKTGAVFGKTSVSGARTVRVSGAGSGMTANWIRVFFGVGPFFLAITPLL
jgi:hypothetical protein